MLIRHSANKPHRGIKLDRQGLESSPFGSLSHNDEERTRSCYPTHGLDRHLETHPIPEPSDCQNDKGGRIVDTDAATGIARLTRSEALGVDAW